MSKGNKHSHGKDQHGHGHHDGSGRAKKKIHHDSRFWVSIVAVVLMLGSMAVYVMSLDESLPLDGGEEPSMPAAVE